MALCIVDGKGTLADEDAPRVKRLRGCLDLVKLVLAVAVAKGIELYHIYMLGCDKKEASHCRYLVCWHLSWLRDRRTMVWIFLVDIFLFLLRCGWRWKHIA